VKGENDKVLVLYCSLPYGYSHNRCRFDANVFRPLWVLFCDNL